jgi:hypothetical protein
MFHYNCCDYRNASWCSSPRESAAVPRRAGRTRGNSASVFCAGATGAALGAVRGVARGGDGRTYSREGATEALAAAARSPATGRRLRGARLRPNLRFTRRLRDYLALHDPR